ncbi:MAG: DUF86 domain-containing protein [Methanomicrobia archaeon]|nr:DUF86 domain-containing protein [Methanomicrobia archaeon]RLF92516.1 MAG: DUF86 domain-containing protein [Thermococci archaeon]
MRKEIEESLDLVKKRLPSGFEEFLNLGLVKDGIYKKIEFSIENIFDICAIINTDLELGIPRDDENIVENLIKNGVLTKEMGKKLRLMKGFRNILVHRYGKIDDTLAFKILTESISDFYDFIKEIEKFLEKK